MTPTALLGLIEEEQAFTVFGRVQGVRGLLIEIAGPLSHMDIGSRLVIETGALTSVPCEIIGFDKDAALAMPFGNLTGVRRGCRAVVQARVGAVRPSTGWLGRVIDAFGQPIDSGPPMPPGADSYNLRADPPAAHRRQRLGATLDLGVRALNTFLPMRRGQRVGLFAGSGVGKSVLMSMIARNAEADVFVIGLIGERGREVSEFIQDELGEDGLRRAVVIVATSDESALTRRQAALLSLTVAEFFRDQGKSVVLMMDSVTRFAMAQRDIGLAMGEPPTTKGYTPTVFAELPRLLERAGPGEGAGSITAFFTVLVDGDDHNEPVADAARGILDGHVVLERAIAERGRYPAVNILKSVSRTMPGACDPIYLSTIKEARALIATYSDMEELIRLGAYRAGTNPEVDRAIRANGPIEAFLAQGKEESTSLSESYSRLADIVNGIG